MKIDLHIHTTASDGIFSPEEIVDLAVERGVEVIAVTDHDVLGGSRRAVEYSKGKRIEVVSGVEFGAEVKSLAVDEVHIVGLFLDLEDKCLVKYSEKLMKARGIHKRKIVDNLVELGYDISFDEIKEEAAGVNYSRAHIARVLIRKFPEIGDFRAVFDKLLGVGGRAYLKQWRASMRETVDIIHEAGGVAVLAHPMLYGFFHSECSNEKIIDRFVECGGDGIEVCYFYENRGVDGVDAEKMTRRVRAVAEEKGLLVCGGGDFHTEHDPHGIGDFGISEEEFLKLKGHWRKKWKKD